MHGLTSFTGRVAIVTGASSGIGEGLARALAGRGAAVALVARRTDRLQALAAELGNRGARALAVACDVAEREQVFAAADRIQKELGRIDLLVNNAGYNTHVLFKDHDLDDVERMLRVNVLGVAYWIKACLPHMRARGEGWIVNLSSVAGKLGQPDEAVYSATKFAVAGLSEGLSYELDPLGIHVLCVHPGVVRTEMFTPEVLARMPADVRKRFIDVEPFCAAVLDALARGDYEVTVPRYMALGYLMRLLLPRVFRRTTEKLRLPSIPDLTR